MLLYLFLGIGIVSSTYIPVCVARVSLTPLSFCRCTPSPSLLKRLQYMGWDQGGGKATGGHASFFPGPWTTPLPTNEPLRPLIFHRRLPSHPPSTWTTASVCTCYVRAATTLYSRQPLCFSGPSLWFLGWTLPVAMPCPCSEPPALNCRLQSNLHLCGLPFPVSLSLSHPVRAADLPVEAGLHHV